MEVVCIFNLLNFTALNIFLRWERRGDIGDKELNSAYR